MMLQVKCVSTSYLVPTTIQQLTQAFSWPLPGAVDQISPLVLYPGMLRDRTERCDHVHSLDNALLQRDRVAHDESLSLRLHPPMCHQLVVYEDVDSLPIMTVHTYQWEQLWLLQRTTLLPERTSLLVRLLCDLHLLASLIRDRTQQRVFVDQQLGWCVVLLLVHVSTGLSQLSPWHNYYPSVNIS